MNMFKVFVKHDRLYFSVGNQSFQLVYEPEDEPELSAGQAAEISRLKGVIAKCEAAIDSHLNPCGCFNGCEFCGGKATFEEAIAAIKEEGL